MLSDVFGGAALMNIAASVVVENSTISGNFATAGAGAIDNYNGDVSLNFTTVLRNLGSVSSAYNLKRFTVANSILENGCKTPIESLGHNVLLGSEDPPCVAGPLPSDKSLLAWDTDVPELADNEGPTPTHKLVVPTNLAKLAIDEADSTPLVCPKTDQRGLPRNDGACDIGAFERQHDDD